LAGKVKLDSATGLIHSIPPAGGATDCGVPLLSIKNREQARGKVKPFHWCEDCKAKRVGV
jgi:hypothetical protein